MFFFFLDRPPWLQLFDRGQFFLFSVGFLGQAMHILTKEKEITIIPYRSTLIFVSVISLVFCILFFAGSVFSNFADSPDIVPRVTIIRYLGIGTFCASMAIGFFVTIADEERKDLDISDLGQQSLRRLEDKITGLGQQP